jgi:hypothetical protein
MKRWRRRRGTIERIMESAKGHPVSYSLACAGLGLLVAARLRKKNNSYQHRVKDSEMYGEPYGEVSKEPMARDPYAEDYLEESAEEYKATVLSRAGKLAEGVWDGMGRLGRSMRTLLDKGEIIIERNALKSAMAGLGTGLVIGIGIARMRKKKPGAGLKA